MVIFFITKILTLMLFLSILNTLRHLFYFIQAIIGSSEDNPSKYVLSNKGLILLGLSIAYILTIIFTGINF